MKKILVRRVDNLGDILLVIPALKIIRKHFKNDHLTLMVKDPHRILVKQFADSFISDAPIEDLKKYSKSFDHIINIEYSAPHGYVAAGVINLPKHIHVGHPRGIKMSLHVSKLICKSLRDHGLKGNFRKPQFVPDRAVTHLATEWLRDAGIKKDNLVVSIDPNCGFDKKCWSLKGFIEVSKFLVGEFNCRIIIPAVHANDKRANEIHKNLPPGSCTILAGQPVDVVASVIKSCDLHIGNDSGLGHLAAAVNTPVVSIFGPTDPFFWKPLTEKIIIVRKKEVECPGGYDHAKICPLQRCLTEITSHDVIDGVLMAFSEYVDPNKIVSLTQLKISETLAIRKTSKGYFLSNNPTNHKCIIQRGWRTVKKIMSAVEQQGTVQHLIEKNPESKLLVDFLILHRIIQFRPL